MCMYIQSVIRRILTGICWVSGCNGVSQTYTKLEWHFSEVKSYNSVSQIRGNCNSIYPINPFFYAMLLSTCGAWSILV
jgi:hypothetical protein